MLSLLLSHMEWNIIFFNTIFSFNFVDINEILCNLQLTIQRVKVMPTPDGRALDLFFITDEM